MHIITKGALIADLWPTPSSPLHYLPLLPDWRDFYEQIDASNSLFGWLLRVNYFFNPQKIVICVRTPWVVLYRDFFWWWKCRRIKVNGQVGLILHSAIMVMELSISIMFDFFCFFSKKSDHRCTNSQARNQNKRARDQTRKRERERKKQYNTTLLSITPLLYPSKLLFLRPHQWLTRVFKNCFEEHLWCARLLLGTSVSRKQNRKSLKPKTEGESCNDR